MNVLGDPTEAPGCDRGAAAAPLSPDADAERRAYVERVVLARCADVLSETEIAAARLDGGSTSVDLVSAMSSPTSAPTMVIPPELARQIVSTIELINERLAAVERWLRIEGRA
jgi:hypothetical protein